MQRREVENENGKRLLYYGFDDAADNDADGHRDDTDDEREDTG